MTEQADSKAEIGQLRARLRAAAGLTQEQLAVAAGVTAKTIGAAEGGEPLRETTLRAIAEALGIPARDYFEPEGYGASAATVQDASR